MKINKHELKIFIVLLLIVASQILPREVNNLDEMWNFNFANCIANGLIPYKDFNIIQGSLLPTICAVFLQIFGKEMLVMRILAIILSATILFMVYKIMSNLEIKEILKYVTIILLTFIMKDYFTIDYNWATLFIILIIFNIELKNKNKIIPNFKKDFLLGVIAGISITVKQTMGLVILSATIGYLIFNIRNREDLKKIMKIILYRALGGLSVITLFVIYLVIIGALNYYFDYAILGTTTFSNKISYMNRLIKNDSILIKILSILPIINLISIYLYIKQKDVKHLVFCTFCLTSLIFVYPIADESHFVIAIVPSIINFIYLINMCIEKIKINKKGELIAQYFLESFIIITTIVFFLIGINDYTKKNINLEIAHFKYLPISKEGIESIQEMVNYITSQEKDVIILDANAAYYMIPIDRYNKDYDMFLKGNLGSKGEEGQIEKLEKLENTQILILNSNYLRNWQNPEKVRKYIIENKNKIGEIGAFDIYE